MHLLINVNKNDYRYIYMHIYAWLITDKKCTIKLHANYSY